jgi:hypothetical protein
MEKNSRQDHGRLGAYVAGQGVRRVQKLCGLRRQNRSDRTCAGPHPPDHSLTQKNDEADDAARGLAQYALSQLLVTSGPIFRCELRQCFVHCGFF